MRPPARRAPEMAFQRGESFLSADRKKACGHLYRLPRSSSLDGFAVRMTQADQSRSARYRWTPFAQGNPLSRQMAWILLAVWRQIQLIPEVHYLGEL
jgi:hypothetical protein